jgi:hypothetical protein
VFFAQKTPDFGPKNRLRIWGVPPFPPNGFFFGEKGVTDLGGPPPPPFTNKIRKVVFEVLPKSHPYFWITFKMHRLEAHKRTRPDVHWGKQGQRPQIP